MEYLAQLFLSECESGKKKKEYTLRLTSENIKFIFENFACVICVILIKFTFYIHQSLTHSK